MSDGPGPILVGLFELAGSIRRGQRKGKRIIACGRSVWLRGEGIERAGAFIPYEDMIAYDWRVDGSVAIAVKSIESGPPWTLAFAVPSGAHDRVDRMLGAMLPRGDVAAAEG